MKLKLHWVKRIQFRKQGLTDFIKIIGVEPSTEDLILLTPLLKKKEFYVLKDLEKKYFFFDHFGFICLNFINFIYTNAERVNNWFFYLLGNVFKVDYFYMLFYFNYFFSIYFLNKKNVKVYFFLFFVKYIVKNLSNVYLQSIKKKL